MKQKNQANKDVEPKGLIVAGMGGGSGKSVVAVGLAACLAGRQYKVYPFKKGPDYIDAGWLQLAARKSCYNLDPYLMSADALLKSFQQRSLSAEICLIEGNRGLYDGVDVSGSFSTAELSRQLGLPVLLVVDCTKTTRTVAAMVLGCLNLEPDVAISGVVLNRIGTSRHESIVRQAIEKYTSVPVLGAIQRMKQDIFPMRHLGVTPFQEYEGAEEAISTLAEIAASSLDIDQILSVMEPVRSGEEISVSEPQIIDRKVRIGILRDAAFQFYYPENLTALEKAGAELVEINSLTAPELPDIHGLYIGGGFPETNVHHLAANVSFRRSVKKTAARGLPIYAECGGLIYLGERMIMEGQEFPLVGIFPITFSLEKRPQAHGYTVLRAEADNPFYPIGTKIKGHEFRYSKIADWPGNPAELVLTMERGVGFAGRRDGLVYKNVLALYTHIHAVGTPLWAPGLVTAAREFKNKN
jgi:cobyrinic acid a,c-diamide synthase